MEIVKARVLDASHIELLRPLKMAQGETVLVSLARLEEVHLERENWIQASLQGLAAAYGADEPEYSLSMVKEPNPDYEEGSKARSCFGACDAEIHTRL